MYKFCFWLVLFFLNSILVFGQQSVIEWYKNYGSLAPDNPEGIIKTSDGGMIVFGHAGENTGDVTTPNPDVGGIKKDFGWVAKLDKNGNILWQTSFVGNNPPQKLQELWKFQTDLFYVEQLLV